MAVYRFSVIIEMDENEYFAYCPELQGCYTQSDSYEETLDNIQGLTYSPLLKCECSAYRLPNNKHFRHILAVSRRWNNISEPLSPCVL